MIKEGVVRLGKTPSSISSKPCDIDEGEPVTYKEKEQARSLEKVAKTIELE